ncbi:hypothetical protein Thiowin_01953 [Thiorhodovibrio winogradskyi]|uniref:Transposase n=1 Tax=Thiorhodovibrio winogradskyi TaxID=77007 RepID=A0ABZ0S7M5_9GAMM
MDEFESLIHCCWESKSHCCWESKSHCCWESKSHCCWESKSQMVFYPEILTPDVFLSSISETEKNNAIQAAFGNLRKGFAKHVCHGFNLTVNEVLVWYIT